MAEMQHFVRTGADLEDLHMDHALSFLKEAHRHIEGLQSVSVLGPSGLNQLGTPNGKFVEIVHIGNHFLTATNVFSSEGQVYIYDSMMSNFCKRSNDTIKLFYS